MPYTPARCDTLMIPSGPGEHLFVITTDACPQQQHVLVNFTSVKPRRTIDTTCIVAAGEHPFIEQESYVLYRSAQLQAAQRLGRLVDGWVYRTGAPATVALTDRILAGFAQSPFTPRFVTAHLRANDWV